MTGSDPPAPWAGQSLRAPVLWGLVFGAVRDHDVIVLEDLRVANMVRRPAPKPDPDTAGVFLPNRARAKAGLNRPIHRSCWGLLGSPS